MKLYDITGALGDILTRITECEDREELDALSAELDDTTGRLEDKLGDYVRVDRGLRAEAEALREEAKRLTERARSTDAKRDALKEWAGRCLQSAGLTQVRTDIATVYVKTAQSVVIDDMGLLANQYLRLEPTPNKEAIKAAIEAGRDVPGAHIETKPYIAVR